MKHYANNEKLSDAALHARTMRSRRVTVARRTCTDLCCSTVRSEPTMLVPRFAYASTPTVTQIA